MTTYFPFGHIIATFNTVETSHPYLSVWNVCETVEESAPEYTAISEIYY